MIKKIITIVVVIIIFVGLYFVTSKKPSNTEIVYDNADLILFWGEGCSHCEKVEAYIKSNNIDTKLKINRKEVFKNADNSKEFQKIINQNCPDLIKPDGIGVPVVLDLNTKKCYQGDVPIIDYLTEKTK